MGKRFRRLPSPSMTVAFIALLAALGGTAVALPGKNSVKKDDIARNAVNSTDIANNTIRTQDLRNSGIRGADVAPNTLTGSDIDEGSLGTVQSANTASTAGTANSANTANTAGTANSAGSVAGQTFKKISLAIPAGTTTPQTFLSAGNLTVTATCNGAGELALLAKNAAGTSMIIDKATTDSETPDSAGHFPASNDEQVADDTSLTTGSFGFQGPPYFDESLHNLTYVSDAGTVVTAQFQTQEETNALGTANDCFVNGHAVVG